MLVAFCTPNMSGWPSGLRRCVQVAVYICRRGFESHFWHTFYMIFLEWIFHISTCSCYNVDGILDLCLNILKNVEHLEGQSWILCKAHARHEDKGWTMFNRIVRINENNQNDKKYAAPNKGLEPLTLRLKVWCSTDWANRAAVSRVRHNILFLICKHIPYM